MNVVMIVPTGLGCKIGGDAGDATPAAKLIGKCSDLFITHPNVVNASDINEMPENTWYVEGSMLDRFLEGKLRLEKPRRHNRILLVGNKPLSPETINAANAARATIGADITLFELPQKLWMGGGLDAQGMPQGQVEGLEQAIEAIRKSLLGPYPPPLRGAICDVIAVHTEIECSREISLEYYRNPGTANPWGKVEAMVSRRMSEALGCPVAHAPLESVQPDDGELYLIFKEGIRPRLAAEAISNCYLHCVLRGLHWAPLPIASQLQHRGLDSTDIDFLVSPIGCWGPPHKAVPNERIIFVDENVTSPNCCSGPLLDGPLPDSSGSVVAATYLEAAGIIMAARAGVTRESVRGTFSEIRRLGCTAKS